MIRNYKYLSAWLAIVVTIPKPSDAVRNKSTYDCVYIHRRKLNETWEQCINRIDINNIQLLSETNVIVTLYN